MATTQAQRRAIPYALGYVRIFVSDYGRAREFYVDTLGLGVAVEACEHGDGWIVFDTERATLLVETGSAENVGRVTGVSLVVPDIQEVYKTLMLRGVEFTGPPTRQPWGGIRTDFYDPDGNELALIEDPR